MMCRKIETLESEIEQLQGSERLVFLLAILALLHPFMFILRQSSPLSFPQFDI